MFFWWNSAGQEGCQLHATGLSHEVPCDPRQQRGARDDDQQAADGPHQMSGVKFRPRSQPGRQNGRDAQDQAHPPCRNDSPAKSQKCRVVRMEYGRMADGEVFYADPRRHLVVEDAVDNRGDDAQNDDFQ